MLALDPGLSGRAGTEGLGRIRLRRVRMQGAHAVCACRVHNLAVGALITCTALAHTPATCIQQITLVVQVLALVAALVVQVLAHTPS